MLALDLCFPTLAVEHSPWHIKVTITSTITDVAVLLAAFNSDLNHSCLGFLVTCERSRRLSRFLSRLLSTFRSSYNKQASVGKVCAINSSLYCLTHEHNTFKTHIYNYSEQKSTSYGCTVLEWLYVFCLSFISPLLLFQYSNLFFTIM